ncbi:MULTISPECIES: hypothetical protein [Stenotrophomonas]|uniref:hypothetical protein n=1 Tax=Stenotrophomonas TaxID=40323 RepID=UPI000A91DA78|nr:MULTISPECIES: hypothetical protein [Stenotrophomonas]
MFGHSGRISIPWLIVTDIARQKAYLTDSRTSVTIENKRFHDFTATAVVVMGRWQGTVAAVPCRENPRR